jgi:hypothetical protein
VTIPVSARLTAHRKSACWALRRLDGPTTNLRYQSKVSARKRPTLTMTNREGVSFHSDCIPLPPTSPQASARRVRQARWRGPELPGVFRADPAPPDPVCAFAQVTGLRPKALRIAKTAPFRYPHWVYEEGLRTTFPQVRGPLEHVVAGEGFEPSKLSRWIYRPTAASLSPARMPWLPTTSARIPHRQPTPAVTNRTFRN